MFKELLKTEMERETKRGILDHWNGEEKVFKQIT